MRKTTSGFTIVELLIVIVVIAILAAISIVTYTGVQQRARDAQRKNDVATIVKALKMYEIDHGPMSTGSGCGSSGNGSGYFNYPYGSSSDINECLKAAGVLQGTVQDPQNTATCISGDADCRKYMKFTCMQDGVLNTCVYANLETAEGAVSNTDTTCGPNLDTTHGMDYYVKV